MSYIGESLRKYSIDPHAESKRLRKIENPLKRQEELTRQVEGYANEVVEDQPVSKLFKYWVRTDGEVYTDPSFDQIFNLKTQFDERERGGYPIRGVYSAINIAKNNTNQLVGLYSPMGPASFDYDPDNPYSQIKFKYGQLYLLYHDGVKVNSAAVKISGQGERWIGKLMGQEYDDINKLSNEQARIKAFVTSPFLLENVDDFASKTHQEDDLFVYKSKDRMYYLADIMRDIKDTFSGIKKGSVIADFDLSDPNKITEQYIRNIYVSMIYNHLIERGEKKTVLGGSCGGDEVSRDDIESLLGIRKIPSVENVVDKLTSNFSSLFRLLNQSGIEPESEYKNKGNCRSCGENTDVGDCRICKKCVETKFSKN